MEPFTLPTPNSCVFLERRLYLTLPRFIEFEAEADLGVEKMQVFVQSDANLEFTPPINSLCVLTVNFLHNNKKVLPPKSRKKRRGAEKVVRAEACVSRFFLTVSHQARTNKPKNRINQVFEKNKR